MKSAIGEVLQNPYGYYLSWEIDLGEPKLPMLWGGNTSLLYSLFHFTMVVGLSRPVVRAEGASLRALAWSANSKPLRTYLEKTEHSFRDLFAFFSKRELKFTIDLVNGNLGLMALNVTEKGNKYQKTLSSEERNEVSRLLRAIWESGGSLTRKP